MKRPKLVTFCCHLALVSLSGGGTALGGDSPRQTFANPPELSADASGVRELRFRPVEHEIDGKRYCLRAYNDSVPGPTIRVPAGQGRRVRIDLYNEFTKQDFREVAGMEGAGHVSCHDFNLTNLHAHGSHIRPDYSIFDANDPCTGEGCGPDSRYHADHVLHQVEAGARARFRWDLDEDHVHYSGTNWYHPHIHGSTAIQVSNGATGAWIVEGDLDQVPGVARARERILVLNHIPYTSEHVVPLADGQACTEDTLSINNFLAVTQVSPTLVNGMLKPRIVTPPNQVERWRFVHAGSPDEMQMAVFDGLDPDCQALNAAQQTPLTQIAADGITLEQPFARNWTFVSSGYRVEAMLKMPAIPKTLCLVALRSRDVGDPRPGDVILVVNVDPAAGPPTETSMPSPAALAAVAPSTSWTGRVDAQQVVASCDSVRATHQKAVLLLPAFATTGMPLSTAPAGSGAPAADPRVPRASDGGACNPHDFPHGGQEVGDCECPEPNINCRNFDNRRALGYRSDRVMTVGDTEKWLAMATDGHPFHVHTNPFVVCPGVTSREPPFAHWRDTYFLQADDPPREFLMEYRKFAGRFTLHCHKLNHEDEGMMELVEICAQDDTDCLCMDGDDPGTCTSNAGCLASDLQCQFAAGATEVFPAPALCSDGPASSNPAGTPALVLLVVCAAAWAFARRKRDRARLEA